MNVKAISIPENGNYVAPPLWPTYPEEGLGLNLYHNDTGWQPGTEYRFILTFHPGEFTITIREGGKVLDEITIFDTTLTSGSFGFYSYLQDQVVFSDYTLENMASRIYDYDAAATDPDNDVLVYSLLTGPDGMEIHPDTGVITWLTTTQDAGENTIQIRVEDVLILLEKKF